MLKGHESYMSLHSYFTERAVTTVQRTWYKKHADYYCCQTPKYIWYAPAANHRKSADSLEQEKVRIRSHATYNKVAAPCCSAVNGMLALVWYETGAAARGLRSRNVNVSISHRRRGVM